MSRCLITAFPDNIIIIIIISSSSNSNNSNNNNNINSAFYAAAAATTTTFSFSLTSPVPTFPELLQARYPIPIPIGVGGLRRPKAQTAARVHQPSPENSQQILGTKSSWQEQQKAQLPPLTYTGHWSDRVTPIKPVTHPLKGRGTARFNIGSMGSPNPHRQPPNQSSPSQPAGRPCGHWQHPSPM